MFRTDLNHWLQSFDHPAFAKFMEVVSMMGTVYFLTLIAFTFIAGVDFKKGILSINVFMWTVLLTLFLKEVIDYPRPLAVDPTLENFGYATGADLRSMMPASFFELFSSEVLTEIRKNDAARLGLPSGHTSLIMAMFVGFAVFIRKRWYTVLSIILLLLTMVSRIYLAQHFLGDVIGGLVLGGSIIWFLYGVIIRLRVDDESRTISKTKLGFFLLPIVTVLLYRYFPAFQTGSFLGINIGYLLVMKLWGQPKIDKVIWKRGVNIIFFFIGNFSGVYFLNQAGLPTLSMLSSILFTLVMLCTFVLTVFIGKQLKLIRF